MQMFSVLCQSFYLLCCSCSCEHYPLQDQDCAYNKSGKAAECRGYKEVKKGSEYALASAVAKVGPVSVGIDAMQSTFQFYKRGE